MKLRSNRTVVSAGETRASQQERPLAVVNMQEEPATSTGESFLSVEKEEKASIAEEDVLASNVVSSSREVDETCKAINKIIASFSGPEVITSSACESDDVDENDLSPERQTSFDLHDFLNSNTPGPSNANATNNVTKTVAKSTDVSDDEFLRQFPEIDINEESNQKSKQNPRRKTIAEYAVPDSSSRAPKRQLVIHDDDCENHNLKRIRTDHDYTSASSSSSTPNRLPLSPKNFNPPDNSNKQVVGPKKTTPFKFVRHYDSSDYDSDSDDDSYDTQRARHFEDDSDHEDNCAKFFKAIDDLPFPSIEDSIKFDIGKVLKNKTINFGKQVVGDKRQQDATRERLLATKCIEKLYSSIVNIPKDTIDQDPRGLRVPLMSHQRHALKWMKWREGQEPSGGILADDMGLGKTLQLISLVLAVKNEEQLNNTNNKKDESEDDSDGEWTVRPKQRRTYHGKTLVVCPPSLIDQWEREVRSKTQKNTLKVYVYHGPSRTISESRLAKFDIVITSYHLLTQEYELHVAPKILRDSRLYKIIWERVILDEAHMIRNYKNKMNMAACEVRTRSRWALTGTPIQNKESDLYALLKFLQCSPFDEKPVWTKWISNCASMGSKRLIVITKSLMLRRTKDELVKKGMIQNLPEKKVQQILVELDPEETIVYQKLLLYSQSFFHEFLRQRKDKEFLKIHGFHRRHKSLITEEVPKNMTRMMKTLMRNHKQIEPHFILVLILRLRQMCCHPSLIQSMLEKEDVELAGGYDEATFVNAFMMDEVQKVLAEEDELDEQDSRLNIDDTVAKNVMSRTNPVFRSERKSSKVRAILKIVKQVVDLGEKVIIVSQWTSYLDVIAQFLDDMEGANYGQFTGKVPVRSRQDVVDRLNDRENPMNILLLSLTCGGVGLNLVGANNLLIIDLHWNPQLEAQAQDRVYRFGQDRNVKIWKFVVNNTIEEKIKQLQDGKLKLAKNVLTGTVSNRLTIEDLKLLFS